MQILLIVLLVAAVILFLFARAAFFVALVGGAIGAAVVGIATGYFLEDAGLGFIVGGIAGGLVGMLVSLHSGVSIGKLGKNSSFSISGLLTVVSFPGYVLNLIQYFLQCPWRGWQKNYDSFFSRFSRCGFGRFVLGTLKCVNYVLCTPIRFVSAFYYNVVIRLLSVLSDLFLEFLVPKTEGMRHKSLFVYLLLWVVKLPWRLVKFIVFKGCLSIFESLFFTVYDTIVPTLTMYHGTSEDASALITSKGNWKVGSGNFAGSGIYFAIYKRTADHYQRFNSNGVIIVSRVSLGRILSMSCAPRSVRNLVANDGDGITRYGLEHGYKSTEWWRKDSGWWEYCLLDSGGSYDHPWRIRELYIYFSETGIKKRIYGCMASWLFS